MKKNHLLVMFLLTILLIHSVSMSAFPISSIISNKEKHTSSNILVTQFQSRINKFPFIQKDNFNSISTTDPTSYSFHPENITQLDDVYHGSNQSFATEWWYFDATLNERYTVQFSIHIYDFFETGFARIQCNIYDEGIPIISTRTIEEMSSLTLSKKVPYITLDNMPIMTCNYDSSGAPDEYFITYSGSNFSFDLIYQSVTKGWKGKHSAGDWAVILPKALVRGKLTIDNLVHPVSGMGYHDHNWNVTISAGMNYGWVWGKTLTKQHGITWANIFETWYSESPLIVVNKDNGGYENIPAEQMSFSITKFKFFYGMILPDGFSILAQTDTCLLSVTIDVIDSDFKTVLGFINYWRYHIHTTGKIIIDNQTEIIDDYSLAEYICFRPY